MNVSAILFIAIVLFTSNYEVLSTKGNSNTSLRRREQIQPPKTTITRLELINAKTDEKITDLIYGQYINVSSITGLTGPDFNINAVVSGPVDVVRFGYNQNAKFRSEATAPYAFCGDKRSDFFSCAELGYGTHYVTATPITNRTRGRLISVTFTIAHH